MNKPIQNTKDLSIEEIDRMQANGLFLYPAKNAPHIKAWKLKIIVFGLEGLIIVTIGLLLVFVYSVLAH